MALPSGNLFGSSSAAPGGDGGEGQAPPAQAAPAFKAPDDRFAAIQALPQDYWAAVGAGDKAKQGNPYNTALLDLQKELEGYGQGGKDLWGGISSNYMGGWNAPSPAPKAPAGQTPDYSKAAAAGGDPFGGPAKTSPAGEPMPGWEPVDMPGFEPAEMPGWEPVDMPGWEPVDMPGWEPVNDFPPPTPMPTDPITPGPNPWDDYDPPLPPPEPYGPPAPSDGGEGNPDDGWGTPDDGNAGGGDFGPTQKYQWGPFLEWLKQTGGKL